MPCVSLQRKNTRLQEENVSLDHFYNLSGVPAEEYIYDFNCFETDGIPIHVRTRRRETHGDAATRWQESVEYTDGLGRLALSKVQAEPGLYKTIEDGVVVEKDSGSASRWVGTGRTIYNNAGNPIKQYEPYFSGTEAYESEPAIVETGVTSILHYDPLDRLIRTDFPDGSYSQVEFSAWDQKSFDQNDTVLDSDWYADRGSPDPIGSEPNNPESRAAWLAAKHAGTATEMHLDALGRPFYSIADNGVQGSYATHTELDILGNPLSVTDARGHVVMSTVYNALSVPCKTESMDAGERKTLQAVDGLPVLGFDSRSHRLRNEYDALRRPTNQWLSENSSTEILIGKTIYGESATSPETHNLRGKLWKSYDQSGLVVNTSYDFKGNLLESTRQFTQVYNATIDWNIAEPDTLLESETFTTITAYDALNRAISIKTPHNANIPASEVLPSYNEASLLERVDVKLRGAITSTNFVNNIDYNAKGQRERIQYGNASTTGYTYDEKTFRLKRLLTTRNNGADTLQDLNYTYDPVGNITQIDDNAQQTIYFNGSVVSPSQKFEYDALYRLTKATGREHVSINASSEPEAEGYNQAQISPQDGSAMRNYVREWQYDSVGNILSLIHNANGNAWTRSYDYASDSNRLNSTTVGQTTVNYTYNAHGSMTSMPHLQGMQWDFAERLSHITRGTIEAYYNYDSSGQRVRKVVEKNGIVETRLYLGGFEIWRKSVNGVLETERETLHVMDDSTRVAVVETLTIDNAVAVANPVPVVRYQLDNHLGSASLELDDLANVISYEEYYPYGDTSYRTGRTASEVSQKRYRYTGKEKDEESGLYYHGARYYACWLGRWTAADPIGVGDGVNLYMYVRSNPIKYHDPSGKAPEKGFWDKAADMASKATKAALDFGSGMSVSVVYNNVKPVDSLTQLPRLLNPSTRGIEKTPLDNAVKSLDRSQEGNVAYELGRLTGDALGIAQGIWEMTTGGAMTGVGVAAEGPTLGLATPVAVGGAVMAAHGGGVTVVATLDLADRLKNLGTMAMAAMDGGKSGGTSNSNKSQKPEVDSKTTKKEELKYSPTKKHQEGGWGTKMDLDDASATEVLNNSIQGGRQRYGYKDGKLYEFQPDNAGGWHGYPIKGNEAPPSVLKEMKETGIISKPEYNRMIRGK